LEHAVTPEELATADDPESYLVSVRDAVERLGMMPVVDADSDSARYLRNGKAIEHRMTELSLSKDRSGDTMVVDRTTGEAVAIVAHAEGTWSYRVVFPEGTS